MVVFLVQLIIPFECLLLLIHCFYKKVGTGAYKKKNHPLIMNTHKSADIVNFKFHLYNAHINH